MSDEDLADLIPTDLATRADLDLAELENIVEARIWAMGRTWTTASLLNAQTARELHRQMFRHVWRWAGSWRRREVNMGVAPEAIQIHLRDLFDDAQVWIEHTTYSPDEIALRLHHRLALIHPFANGNGRHARLCADLLARTLGSPPFTWSGGDLGRPEATRGRYLAALQALDRDRDDVAALLEFARS